MTTPFPFVAGQVLTAAQLNEIQNLPISDKTASYTLVAGDETKRTMMNNASATTITVSNGHSVMYFTSPTVVVYELILNDAVFGIIDADNVLG